MDQRKKKAQNGLVLGNDDNDAIAAAADMDADENGKGIVQPLLALGLVLLPVLIMYAGQHMYRATSVLLLLCIALPIIGFNIGLQSLFAMKGKRNFAGKLIAVTAVTLPSAAVLFVVVFFIGATTGIISLM